MKKSLAIIIFALTFAPLVATAATEGGLTLLEAPAARASALGQAYSAAQNDIAAFGYNPASLSSMKSGQASFSFERGFAEDSFGQLQLGVPTEHGGIGAAVGFYDGGTIKFLDGGREVEIRAQRDILVGLGMARRLGDAQMGVQGKYFSSQLGETQSATAFAADLGVGMNIRPGLHFGAALQNYGTPLRYDRVGDDLPRIARAGLEYSISPRGIPTQLLLDVPYHVNVQEIRPALGIEAQLGVLAFRAGYKITSQENELSFGTGFMIGQTNLDYAFGLMDNSASVHRVTFALRFSPARIRPSPSDLSNKEHKSESEGLIPASAPAISDEERKEFIRQWYRSRYTLGQLDLSPKEWEKIYRENWHLIEDGEKKDKNNVTE